MPEYTTLYVGMAVHKDAIAVADVATDHDAQVMFLGTIGTRHADCDQRILQLHSKAKHLVFGPTGGDLRSYVICSISSSEKGLHQRCRLCQLSCPEREADDVEHSDLVYAAVIMPINSVNRS